MHIPFVLTLPFLLVTKHVCFTLRTFSLLLDLEEQLKTSKEMSSETQAQLEKLQTSVEVRQFISIPVCY